MAYHIIDTITCYDMLIKDPLIESGGPAGICMLVLMMLMMRCDVL